MYDHWKHSIFLSIRMNTQRAYKLSLAMSIVAIIVIVIALLGWQFGWWSSKRDFVSWNQNYLAQQRGVSGDFQNIDGELLIWPFSDLWRQRYTFFDTSLMTTTQWDAKPRFSFWVYNFTFEDAKRRMHEWGSKQVSIQWIIESRQYGQDGSQFAQLQEVFRDNPSVHMIGDERLWVNYQHAKTFLTSDRFIIQTANMTYSSFTKNREIFFMSADTGVVQSLQTLFRNDWAWITTNADALHPNLVVCPINCRQRTESLLESAQSSIYSYQQYIQDEEIQRILIDKKKQWVDIKLILGNDPTKVATLEVAEEPDYRTADASVSAPRSVANYVFDANKVKPARPDQEEEFLRYLSGNIVVQTSPYVHAKAFLVDNQFLLIGSMNISANSIDKNREIGILLLWTEQLSKFTNMFLKDWNRWVGKIMK